MLVWCLLLLAAIDASSLLLPSKWQATIRITQHLLDSSYSSYPPRDTILEVQFDREQEIVVVKTVQGVNQGQAFIRNYKNRWEKWLYLGRCEVATLLEEFPVVNVPSNVHYISNSHFVSMHGERSHVYLDPTLKYIEKVVVESLNTPITTYQVVDMEVGTSGLFFSPQECVTRVGGWPYISLLHNYLYV